MQMTDQSPWTIQATKASFQSHDWKGMFDLNAPSNGGDLGHNGRSTIDRLMSVEFDGPQQALLKDCYMRESDLIVVYPQREERPFSVQLNWRILEASAERLCLELWVSIQTYLLHTHPEVEVGLPLDQPSLVEYSASELTSETDYSQVTACIQGVRASTHLALLLHPSDHCDTSWSWSSGHSHYQARLFGHFMEKGVIRRGRLRCLVSNEALSPSQLRQAMHDFASSPLPLTA